ncbi:flagellar hook-length control protein FliK [Erwinia mallotivora]|uniref:flagellar hook-length control protein FliK n=1 Tax=Erwinia mallotivora TaxID=69222 RepID=UPI0021BE3B78|nr:flagellar hook-length control protein FliK [Erwinia mallotivora]
MNTLPIVVNATKVSTTTASSGSAATTGDATTDVSLGDNPQDTGSQGFLSLLGNKLLKQALQGQTVAKGTVTTPASETSTTDVAEGSQSARTKLNKLLASLNQPETTTSLLSSVKAAADSKTEQTSTDSNTDNTAVSTTLSNSDMQAMQALFAMLPPAQQPQATLKAGSTDAQSENDSIKGDKQSTLASLLSGNNGVSTEDESNTNTKASDRSSAALSLNANTGNSAAKNSADSSQLNTAFQQVLSHVTKETDKENSSSSTSTTITSNVVSAASAALTPATTTTVTAPATSQLSSQLGSPEWQQALGQQIVMFSRNGQQTAELHLHPQDLGSIQISLKLDNDQAQLNMVSGHSEVRAALEAALPQLRSALAESGINLGQSNVSSDAFQQGQSFSGQQEQQRNNSGGNTFSLSAENDSDVTAIAVPASLQARASGTGAVDIFA